MGWLSSIVWDIWSTSVAFSFNTFIFFFFFFFQAFIQMTCTRRSMHVNTVKKISNQRQQTMDTNGKHLKLVSLKQRLDIEFVWRYTTKTLDFIGIFVLKISIIFFFIFRRKFGSAKIWNCRPQSSVVHVPIPNKPKNRRGFFCLFERISIIRIFEVNPNSRAAEHRMSIVFTSSVSALPHAEPKNYFIIPSWYCICSRFSNSVGTMLYAYHYYHTRYTAGPCWSLFTSMCVDMSVYVHMCGCVSVCALCMCEHMWICMAIGTRKSKTTKKKAERSNVWACVAAANVREVDFSLRTVSILYYCGWLRRKIVLLRSLRTTISEIFITKIETQFRRHFFLSSKSSYFQWIKNLYSQVVQVKSWIFILKKLK